MLTPREDNITTGVRAMNLRDPVMIHVVKSFRGVCHSPENTHGLYRGRLNGEAHIIYVSGNCNESDGSFNLWHELYHALQCERYHGSSWASYIAEFTRQLRACGASAFERGFLPEAEFLRNYNTVPYEREANRFANTVCDAEDVPMLFHNEPQFCPTNLLHSLLID